MENKKLVIFNESSKATLFLKDSLNKVKNFLEYILKNEYDENETLSEKYALILNSSKDKVIINSNHASIYPKGRIPKLRDYYTYIYPTLTDISIPPSKYQNNKYIDFSGQTNLKSGPIYTTGADIYDNLQSANYIYNELSDHKDELDDQLKQTQKELDKNIDAALIINNLFKVNRDIRRQKIVVRTLEKRISALEEVLIAYQVIMKDTKLALKKFLQDHKDEINTMNESLNSNPINNVTTFDIEDRLNDLKKVSKYINENLYVNLSETDCYHPNNVSNQIPEKIINNNRFSYLTEDLPSLNTITYTMNIDEYINMNSNNYKEYNLLSKKDAYNNLYYLSDSINMVNSEVNQLKTLYEDLILAEQNNNSDSITDYINEQYNECNQSLRKLNLKIVVISDIVRKSKSVLKENII